MLILFLYLFPTVVLAYQPSSLARLQHDKIMHLYTQQASLQALDEELAVLALPYDDALTSTIHLGSAISLTDNQLAETAHAVQKKLITLAWLTSELHHGTAQSRLLSRLLDNVSHRADTLLYRVIKSSKKLSSLQYKLTQMSTELLQRMRLLESYYHVLMVYDTSFDYLIRRQRGQQHRDFSYNNTLLNLLYGHPVGGRAPKSTKRFTPFSSYVPSPVTGSVIAAHRFPGLGFGVLVSHSGNYTLVTGIESPEVHIGSWVEAGTVLGKLHESASDVLVLSWQKQDIEYQH